MISSLIFSLIGTLVLGLSGVGLVYLMAAAGGGQRAQVGGRAEGRASRRPGRSSAQRAGKS